MKCLRCQNEFHSNPLFKNDNVCPTCERMTSMTFWLPRLQRYNFPTPKTIMVNADVGLDSLLDGETPKGSERFFHELENAVDIVGLPAFLRTEMLSNKHDWENSCFVQSKDQLIGHVTNLIEMSELARIDIGMDRSFFAVREFIKTEKAFTFFNGNMPITKEVRVFIKNGKIECWHPYWPVDIFEGIDSDLVNDVRGLNLRQKETVEKMGAFIAKIFQGWWSVDLLRSWDGDWYVTDMAIGEASYHDPECEHCLKSEVPPEGGK